MSCHQLLGLLLIISTCSQSRGPHHPRGESIIKHHVHYRPTKNQETHEKITQDSELLHDKEHIREDLGWIDGKTIDEMSDEELEFHYFNLHDSDKNSHLDGLEILQAMRHTSEHDDHDDDYDDDSHDVDNSHDDFEFFVDLIDEVLLQDDVDDDGFISYPEYVAAKKKDVQSKGLTDIGTVTNLS